MCWNTRLFSMAKLLPRSAYLIRYGITEPSVCMSLRLFVCLSVRSTLKFLITIRLGQDFKRSMADLILSPARQDLSLNLDASQVFYNLHHTHTHRQRHAAYTRKYVPYIYILILTLAAAQVESFFRFMCNIFGPHLPKAKAKVQRNQSVRLEGSIYLTHDRSPYISHTLF